jgi:hypothetical protein
MPDLHDVPLTQADAELLYTLVTRELESSRGEQHHTSAGEYKDTIKVHIEHCRALRHKLEAHARPHAKTASS